MIEGNSRKDSDVAGKVRKKRKAPEIVKPKKSLRERNKKASETKGKPKRVRKTASTIGSTLGGAVKLLNAERHAIPRKKKDSFFHKTRRITPSYFVKSIAELKNVTWPGRKETWKLVFAVFVFSLVIGLFIAGLDYVLTKVFREIIL